MFFHSKKFEAVVNLARHHGGNALPLVACTVWFHCGSIPSCIPYNFAASAIWHVGSKAPSDCYGFHERNNLSRTFKVVRMCINVCSADMGAQVKSRKWQICMVKSHKSHCARLVIFRMKYFAVYLMPIIRSEEMIFLSGSEYCSITHVEIQGTFSSVWPLPYYIYIIHFRYFLIRYELTDKKFNSLLRRRHSNGTTGAVEISYGW